MTDKRQYVKNDNVNIELNFKNKKEVNYECSTNLKIINSDNTIVFATTTTLNLISNGSVSLSYNFILPKDVVEGIYIIQAEADSDGAKIGLASGAFEVVQKFLRLKLLPFTLIPMSTNTINFEIANSGVVDLAGGMSTLVFKSPNKDLLWKGTSTFGTISVGDTISLSFDMPVQEIKFGNYQLEYYLTYDDKSIFNQVNIPCNVLLKDEFDKPYYRIRENLSGTITIINTGKFKEDLEVTTNIKALNFETHTTMILLPNQKGSLSWITFIPATATSGYHDGTVSLRLGTSTKNEQFKFYIPEAKLKLDMANISYSTSEDISFKIENEGGVDAIYDCVIKLIDSSFRICKEENRNIGTITAGNSAPPVNFNIPSQLVTGDYSLIVSGTPTFTKLIHIQGISANMELSSNKVDYISGETITAMAKMENVGIGEIKDGTLTFMVWKNISKIHNDIVEFGFDNNGMINHASFLGGENLLDEFQVGIKYPGWSLTSLQGGPWSGHEFHVSNRIYAENYYEVEGYFEDKNNKVWLTSRYKLFRGTATYLDCWYTINPEKEWHATLWDFPISFFLFLDSKKRGLEMKSLSETSFWQMSQYPKNDWCVDFDDWRDPMLFSVGNETKIGFASMKLYTVRSKLQMLNADDYKEDKAMVVKGMVLDETYEGGEAIDIKEKILSDNLFPAYIEERDAWSQKWNLWFGPEAPDPPVHIFVRLEIKGNSMPIKEDNASIVTTISLPLNIAQNQSTTTLMNINLSPELKGKLYLATYLHSNTNQLITSSVSPFYINPVDISLSLKTDKEIYKLGEIVEIEIKAKNTGTKTMTDLILEVFMGTSTIYTSSSFSLEAQSTITTFTIQATVTHSFMLTAKIKNSKGRQVSINIIEIPQTICVGEPKIDVEIESAMVIGRGTESVRIILKNPTAIPIMVNGKFQVGTEGWSELGTITLAEKETKLIEANYQLPITSYSLPFATITLSLTGDVHTITTKQVEFGELVDLAVKPDLVYPIGYLEVPFEVVNRGKLDSEFAGTFTILATEAQRNSNPQRTQISQIINDIQANLSKSVPSVSTQLPTWCQAMPKIVIRGHKINPQITQMAQISEKIRVNPSKSVQSVSNNSVIFVCKFYVPTGGTITGSLIFELEEGGYELGYEYFRGTGSNSFKVASENVARISDFGFRISDFEIAVKNLGSNRFNGQLNFETPFYQTKTTVNLEVDKGATYTWTLVPGTQATLLTGTYTAKAVILYDGNEIDRKEIVFGLEPRFKMLDIGYTELTIGKEGTITVGIKNIGNAFGEAKVKVKLLDLVDEERTIWLVPEEVGTINFRLQIPADFEDGTYSLVVLVEGAGMSGEIIATETLSLVRIVGIRLNVVANLDKGYYGDGEMATLTLTVTNLSNVSLGTLNLSAKVRFNGYEGTTTFLLSPSYFSFLTFNFPIYHRGQKLNFGIYSADDRAIWLDAIYVRQGGTLTIISDKQVYGQGETVTLTMIAWETGTVSLTTPGEPATGTIEFNEPGTQTFSFKLPSQMLTGTYYIYHSSLIPSPSFLAFDVRGIKAVIREVKVDKEEGYGLNEMFNLKIWVNNLTDNFEGGLKAWIVSSNGTWTKICERSEIFQQGINSYEIRGTTTALGEQKVVYGVYLGTNTLVTSGSKQIDVYNIKSGEAKVIIRGAFKVEIPKGGLDRGNRFNFEETTIYPLPLKDIKPIKVLKFSLEPGDTKILQSIKVTFSYDKLPEGVIEGSLKGYYITNGKWEEVGSQELDMVNKELVFYLPHLSLVGIGAKVVKPLADVKVYPNPAKEQVIFGDNLPSLIKVRIFNVAGEEVHNYEEATTSGKGSWNLRNKENERVVSGIYIYVITTPQGDKKVGKIGVIK